MSRSFSRRRAWAVSGALACLAGCGGSPPRKDIDLGPQALLPWQAVRGIEHYGREDLGLALAGDAEICLPFGAVGAHVVRLAHEGREADLCALECGSPEEAFGAFAALRAAKGIGRSVPAGAAATLHDGVIRAWKGRYVVTVRNVAGMGDDDLIRAAGTALAPLTEPSRLPPLVRALPRRNLMAGSELAFVYRRTLALAWDSGGEDILRLGDHGVDAPAAEGALAQYMFDRCDGSLCVIAYKDRDRASAVEKDFVERMRKGAALYRRTERFHEMQREDGATALACRRGAYLVLVPPTRVPAAMKAVAGELLRALPEDRG
ncbi:MAG TPA: hypothetical protein DCM87_09985 [Planctomycetes bacterium]|nr:hypothetical protein [Planctomycetota bacterium]